MSVTTRWSLIRRAAGEDRDARLALTELCLQWRPAVLRYLRRSHPGAEAEDLTQGFFLHLLEHRLLARGDPARGRFRDFLYTALRHWLADQQRRRDALCRGGGSVTIEFNPELPGADEDPAAAFDRCWAECLLQRALEQLAAEAQHQGKQALYDAAAPFLLQSPDALDYREAAAALGLRPNTFAVAVSRLRRRLQTLVQREVGETTDTEDEARAELRRLRGTWQ